MAVNQLAERKARVDAVRREYDATARLPCRVSAVRFMSRGRPVDVSVYDELVDAMHRQVRFRAEDTVLDVGTGSGLLLDRLANRVRRAVGTDLSAEQLQHIPPRPGVAACAAAGDSLPFVDATFDKVVCHGVFQHFPDKDYARATLSEMVRVCRPGGAIYVGSLFNEYLREVFLDIGGQRQVSVRQVAATRVRKALGRYQAPYYLFLSPAEMVRWAAELGCRRACPLLQVTESVDPLYRMFRFDLLIDR